MNNITLGKIGEDIATNYLINLQYTIRQRNYTCHWGELDIIAEKEGKIIFVEVKTRIGHHLGKPHESVHYKKLRHLQRTIQYYLLQHKLYKAKLQLDVISIILNKEKKLELFQHYENMSFT